MKRIEVTPALNLTGCMLVASPNWIDPLFSRSVCLVVHHSQDGAIGVLLNKALNTQAKALLKQFGGLIKKSDNRPELFLGGLQSGPVVAMHQRKDLAEFEPAEGVYFAAQVNSLKQLIADAQHPCRFYVGQAVWEKDLLNQQFTSGYWLPLTINSNVAFEAADAMWPRAMREVGNRVVAGMCSCHVPSSVELN